jgi:hypothetical protein
MMQVHTCDDMAGSNYWCLRVGVKRRNLVISLSVKWQRKVEP